MHCQPRKVEIDRIPSAFDELAGSTSSHFFQQMVHVETRQKKVASNLAASVF